MHSTSDAQILCKCSTDARKRVRMRPGPHWFRQHRCASFQNSVYINQHYFFFPRSRGRCPPHPTPSNVPNGSNDETRPLRTTEGSSSGRPGRQEMDRPLRELVQERSDPPAAGTARPGRRNAAVPQLPRLQLPWPQRHLHR